MSTNSRGLKHGNFKSNWPTCLSPCGQSATQPKFAQFWGVRRSRAVLFVASKRVGAIVGLLFLATAATARLRKVFGPKPLKWWLLKTRQIYMSCSPSGNCKGMYRRCLLSPQRSNIALGKISTKIKCMQEGLARKVAFQRNVIKCHQFFGWGMTLFLPQIITHLLDSLGEVRLTRGIGCDADVGNHDKSNT